MKTYLESKFLEFKKIYNAERFLDIFCVDELKRQWNRDYEETKKQYATIMSMEDIRKYLDAYGSALDRYLTNSGADIYCVNLALYKLTYAITKMVSCYDNSRCDFHFNDAEEIDKWFDKLHNQIESMQREIHRRSIVDDYY